jgi:hypothetical protein
VETRCSCWTIAMTWSTRSPGMGSIDSMYRSAMCCCFDGGMTVALQPPHHCSASKHDCHAQVDDMYVTRSVAMLLTMHPSSSHLMSKRCSSDTKGNRMLCCIACSVALQSQLGGNARSGGRFFIKFSDGGLKGGRGGRGEPDLRQPTPCQSITCELGV